MQFLADMGVSQHVVTWLREQGHDATHLRDEDLQTLENGAIFTKAFCREPTPISARQLKGAFM